MKLISYLKFLLKSTNHHGVHSPFVFKYLTECVYKKPQVSQIKTQDILLKSIAFFEFKNIWLEESREVQQLIEDDFPNVHLNDENPDFVYYPSPLIAQIPFNKLHNDGMILIDKIHNSTKNYSSWLELVKSSDISVSIDFYNCGVLFIRKEQEKEHFYLRP
ncbi:hypothetical protein [Croceivirga thetidis]|uniref:Uncharacterized protein n=1 Tax=Croceivirga thetidis TaxID=2721623 RepID=A0ABX1GUZ4_9FLAO|nr:hypothetical protein [Croceivirga thetidis]NKI32876.1 hypothetical protein [Croceivirga thetidis]